MSGPNTDYDPVEVTPLKADQVEAMREAALAAMNPDAWVADRNLDRYDATGDLDVRYLQSLSADAAPVIVERLPEQVAGCVVQVLTYNSLRPEALEDARAWNLGRSRAEDALERIDLPARADGGGDPCAGVWTAFGE